MIWKQDGSSLVSGAGDEVYRIRDGDSEAFWSVVSNGVIQREGTSANVEEAKAAVTRYLIERQREGTREHYFIFFVDELGHAAYVEMVDDLDALHDALIQWYDSFNLRERTKKGDVALYVFPYGDTDEIREHIRDLEAMRLANRNAYLYEALLTVTDEWWVYEGLLCLLHLEYVCVIWADEGGYQFRVIHAGKITEQGAAASLADAKAVAVREATPSSYIRSYQWYNEGSQRLQRGKGLHLCDSCIHCKTRFRHLDEWTFERAYYCDLTLADVTAKGRHKRDDVIRCNAFKANAYLKTVWNNQQAAICHKSLEAVKRLLGEIRSEAD
jgi:hypothetical protein